MVGEILESAWDVRPVPVSGRGPIAAFQLEVLEEVESHLSLDSLDMMDLLALVRSGEDGDTLDGLAYLSDMSDGLGHLGLLWFRHGVSRAGRLQLLDSVDAWAQDRSIQKIRGLVTIPRNPRKWGEDHGFTVSRRREVERAIPSVVEVMH